MLDKKYWKSILAEETIANETLKLIMLNLPHNLLLCKLMPRRGPLFNTVRYNMDATPKELRRILVENSKKFKEINAISN